MKEKKIIIDDQTWTIKEVENTSGELFIDNAKCLGVCNYVKNTIYIDASLNKTRKINTLRHELAHAFTDAYLLKNVEQYDKEELCNFVALYAEKICYFANSFYREEAHNDK